MSKEAFEETLANAPFIALASSVDNQPNVRLVDTGAIIRVQKAQVKETDITLDEIKDALIAKRAGFEHLLGMLSQEPVVYQICFDEALFTVHGQKEVITL